jgi:polysaccharide deacetylase family protein (PEP-CTERM system associated)
MGLSRGDRLDTVNDRRVQEKESVNPAVRNALSVDVEEYYHAVVFREATQGISAHSFASRVVESVERVLALFARHEVRATFFILGEVAAAQPALIQKIAAEGHEVACHGDRHELVWHQTAQEFRADINRAKGLLEDITGQAVIGYRAPNFSIGRAQGWAYDILLEEGFRYDSSVYPILHDRYGHPGAPRFPYEIRRNGHGGLIEFPIGTARFWGVNLPFGGGGYFRLLPLALIRYGIRRVNAHEGQPIMFYFHPWELDPDQPRPPMSWHHHFRHYVGLRREAAKLSRLLQHFRFSTARDILGIQ